MSSFLCQTYPPNPPTSRGTSTKIGMSLGPKGDRDLVGYASGKVIVVRDLKDPTKDYIYAGHAYTTTVVKFSPTGYYAASGDVAGNVKIWDTTGDEHILKSEFKVLGGRVNDLSWDGESKRVIAVGDGREKFAHCFQFDTGTSTGDILGHAKVLNSVAIRHQRPFRAVTAGDDGGIVFSHGVPWKWNKTLSAHTSFIHSVAYAPSGSHFVSAGADGHVFLWDGVTGDKSGEFVDPAVGSAAHKGGVYSVSWSLDGKSIVTSSGDCTVKIWDPTTFAPTFIHAITSGKGIDNQQVGNTWTKSFVVSLGINGLLNIWDAQGEKLVKVVEAPQRSITSTTMMQSPTLLFGSSDGRTHSVSFASPTEVPRLIPGAGHTNLVSGLSSSNKDASVWSVGFDDQIREIRSGVNGLEFMGTSTKTLSQPKSVCASPSGHTYVASVSNIEVFRGLQRVATVDLGNKWQAVSIDVVERAGKEVVAVGGEDMKVHLYTFEGTTLIEDGTLESSHKGAITAVAFSPDGKSIAVGDGGGKIFVYDVETRKPIILRWTHHTARVHSLSWTPDGKHVASGSLDTHIYVWCIEKQLKHIAIKNAIPGGVWGVAWIPGGKAKLVGAGADGSVRTWEAMFHVW
ncbi:WD40 repeat-like protein [Hysterangium stoloniferum]|nr:WD40 repeat-like protein [Hysterangium stoloniferum]